MSTIIVACGKTPAAPMLTQQAYIWQRVWTPALATSIAAAQDHFSGWRVLVMEGDAGGTLIDTAPQLNLLASSRRPVVLVVRLNGSHPPPSTDVLAVRLREAVSRWRAAGIMVAGVEIDHDCATAQLDRYADFLAALRGASPTDLQLSITVLPTWIGAPALARVLAQIDASVLQVHAISAPRSGQAPFGLFDAQRARRWIDAYAALSPRPFQVALPAYGLRVGFDDDGRAIAVEGEMPRDQEANNSQELRVRPDDVAGLLRSLRDTRSPRLTGIVWFRLPSADDRRAWSLQTLQAVIGGRSLSAQLVARVETAEGGARDLVLSNSGAIDAPLPESVFVRAGSCSAADALDGFTAQPENDGWRFFRRVGTRASDAILKAGSERRIGWLRCATVDGVSIHEVP